MNENSYFIVLPNGKSKEYSEKDFNSPNVQKYLNDNYGQYTAYRKTPYDVVEGGDYGQYSITLENGNSKTYDKDKFNSDNVQKFLQQNPNAKVHGIQPYDIHEKSARELTEKLDTFNRNNASFFDEYEQNQAEFNKMIAPGAHITDADSITGSSQKAFLDQYKEQYENLKAEKEALQKEYYSNPYVQRTRQMTAKDLSKQIAADTEALDKYRDTDEYKRAKRGRTSINNSSLPTAFGILHRGSSEGMQVLKGADMYEAAIQLNKESRDLYNAKGKDEVNGSGFGNAVAEGFENFMQGAGNTVTNKEFWSKIGAMRNDFALMDLHEKVINLTGGYNNLDEDGVAERLEKELTEPEKALLIAYFSSGQAAIDNNERIHWTYNAGKSSMESVRFMAEMMATSGLGVTTKVNDAIGNGMIKWFASKAVGQTGLKRALIKGAGKVLTSDLRAMGAGLVQTAVSPTTYANITDMMVQIDNTGHLTDATQAIAAGLFDSAIENSTEFGLGLTNHGLALGSKGLFRAVGKTKFGEFYSPKVKGFLRSAGIGNPLEEWGEEVNGAYIRELAGRLTDNYLGNQGEWNQFWTLENQLTTITSFAPTIVGGGVVSAAQRKAYRNNMESRGRDLSKLLLGAGYTADDVNAILDTVRGDTPSDLAGKASPYLQQILRDNKHNKRLVAAFLDYVDATAKALEADSRNAKDLGLQRSIAQDEINDEMGGRQWWVDDTADTASGPLTQQRVRRIEHDGKVGYVVGTDQLGNYMMQYEDGTNGFLMPSAVDEAVQQGRSSDTGDMVMNDFLDLRLSHNRQVEERTRMENEQRQRIKDFLDQHPVEAQVNLGTEEAPIIGTITEYRDNDKLAVVLNPSTKKYEEYTVDDLATRAGLPAPKTNEQLDNEEYEAIMADKKAKAEAEGTVDPVVIEDEQAAEEAPAEEQTDDGVLRDYKGNPIPLKKDGNVDQTKFWNADPEAWARWNDEKRQDGGVNSLGYIGKAIGALSANIKTLQKQLDKETDFDKIDNIEQAMSSLEARAKTLIDLKAAYESRFAQQEAEANAQAEAEARAVAAQAEAEQQRLEELERDSASIPVKEILQELSQLSPEEMGFENAVMYSMYGARFIWASDGVFKGLKDSIIATGTEANKDRMKYIGWLANADKGGMYPSEVVHSIWETMPEAWVEQYSDADVRDIVYDAMQAYNSPAQLIRAVYDNVVGMRNRAEAEHERQQKDEYARELGFANWEDYTTFEELWQSGELAEGRHTVEEINEIYSIYGEESEAGIDAGVSGVVSESAGQEGDSSPGSDSSSTEQDGKQGGSNDRTGSEESTSPVVAQSAELTEQVESKHKQWLIDHINSIDDGNLVYSLDDSLDADLSEYGEAQLQQIWELAKKWSDLQGKAVRLQQEGKTDEAMEIGNSSIPLWDEMAKIIKEGPKSKEENEQISRKGYVELNGETYDIPALEEQFRGDIELLLNDSGIDVDIVGVKLIGSRIAGSPRVDSDLDLLVEYTGDYAEDALFNVLNGEGFEINGVKVDINPITAGKSGTIEQFLERNSGYVKTQSNTNSQTGEQEQKADDIANTPAQAVEINVTDGESARKWLNAKYDGQAAPIGGGHAVAWIDALSDEDAMVLYRAETEGVDDSKAEDDAFEVFHYYDDIAEGETPSESARPILEKYGKVFQDENAEAGDMTDEELLGKIGTDSSTGNEYSDEYDSRHADEYEQEKVAYMDMLIENAATLEQAEEMSFNVTKRYINGGYNSVERTKLIAQIDAIDEYISSIENEDVEDEQATDTDKTISVDNLELPEGIELSRVNDSVYDINDNGKINRSLSVWVDKNGVFVRIVGNGLKKFADAFGYKYDRGNKHLRPDVRIPIDGRNFTEAYEKAKSALDGTWKKKAPKGRLTGTISADGVDVNYITAGEYYENENLRKLAHGIKEGNMDSIKKAAEIMAKLIPSDALIIPMPSHTGKATTILRLAEEIAKITNTPVADILRGKERASQYESRKQNSPLKAEDMGMHILGSMEPYSGLKPVIIDNVISSGETAKAAVQVIPDAIVVSLAIDSSAGKTTPPTGTDSPSSGNESSDKTQNQNTAPSLSSEDTAKLKDLYEQGAKKQEKTEKDREGLMRSILRDMSDDDFAKQQEETSKLKDTTFEEWLDSESKRIQEYLGGNSASMTVLESNARMAGQANVYNEAERRRVAEEKARRSTPKTTFFDPAKSQQEGYDKGVEQAKDIKAVGILKAWAQDADDLIRSAARAIEGLGKRGVDSNIYQGEYNRYYAEIAEARGRIKAYQEAESRITDAEDYDAGAWKEGVEEKPGSLTVDGVERAVKISVSTRGSGRNRTEVITYETSGHKFDIAADAVEYYRYIAANKAKREEEQNKAEAKEVKQKTEEVAENPTGNAVKASAVKVKAQLASVNIEEPITERPEDFGEKIGGARKDDIITRRRTGKKSDMPAWRKKYQFRNFLPEVQNVFSSVEEQKGVKIPAADKINALLQSEVITLGKPLYDETKPFVAFWDEEKGKGMFKRVIHHPVVDSDRNLVVFNSMEEAEAVLPVFEARSLGFRVGTNDKGKHIIYRRASNGKEVQYAEFDTKEEAAAYLASPEGARSLVEHKRENFDIPGLTEVTRTNMPDYRKGKNVTTEQFMNTFGFRGGEFGNWLSTEERQSVLNIAYDSLMDLAAVLGISPKAISLNGELGIAFGARGTGNAGFRGAGAAHYENARAVINLTKMNGAGSLAHEWAHALDNYFGMMDNKQDRKAEKHSTDHYLTNGRSYRGGVRKEILSAFDAIVKAMTEQVVENENAVSDAEAEVEKMLKQIDREAKYYREQFERGLTRYKYNRKTKQREQVVTKPTPEQLAEYDRLIEELKNSTDYKWEWTTTGKFAGNFAPKGEAAEKLLELVKDVKPGEHGKFKTMHNVWYQMDRLQKAKASLEKRRNTETNTKTVPTRLVDDSIWFDKGRASSYWSTKVELFARCFESFVDRKIKAAGGTSDYLTYDKSDVYMAAWEHTPYPAGEEIPAIDGAFENLFNVIDEQVGEDGKVMLNEPGVVYTSADGKETEYVSLLHESEEESQSVSDRGGEAANNRAGSNRVRRENNSPTGIKLRQLEGDEFCLVEAQYTENKYYSFTSKNKIATFEDVAYIFKSLQDSAVEHVFAVLVKNGKPTVIHIGMGGIGASYAELRVLIPAVNDIKPDAMFLVHNHPSGNLNPSRDDRELLNKMRGMFGSKVMDGVIIDSFRNQFSTFGAYANDIHDMPESKGKEKKQKVYTFDKLMFVQNIKRSKILSSIDVASFIASQRLGLRNKFSALILTNNNEVVGNIHLVYDQINGNEDAIAKDIEDMAVRMGAGNVILYGNNIDINEAAKVHNSTRKYQINLTDVVNLRNRVDGFPISEYDSAMENGLMEPNPVYERARSEAQIGEGDETFENDTEAKQWVTQELLDILGDDVVLVSQEQAEKEAGVEKMSKGQKRALETVSLAQEQDQPTVVSSADGANVLKKLRNLKDKFEEITNRANTFIGDVAEALGAKKHGSNSEYATFETKNGRIITIRLANHNAKVSNFDNKDENEGISIVISAKGNNGVINDGNAHIVEFYYDAIKLRRAEGKPLVDIISSIEQALYSGEYKDTTGLAEREEVNTSDVEAMIAYHGTAADFDAFDNSHMGEGEGSQVHGWGTYVAFTDGTARKYARLLGQYGVVYTGFYPIGDSFEWNEMQDLLREFDGNPTTAYMQSRIDNYRKWLENREKTHGLDDNQKRTLALYSNIDASDFELRHNRFVYSVDVPEDNGSNYIDEGNDNRDYLKEIAGKLGKHADMFTYGIDHGYINNFRQMYERLSKDEGGEENASKYLYDAGFVGIRYNGIQDKECAVIFNDKDIKITDKTQFSKNGRTVYGYAKDGKVYLSPDGINPNTPIHEYTHLWAKAMQKRNPAGWADIVKLLKGTAVWNEVLADESYQNLNSDDAIASEVLSRISGSENAKKMIAEAEKVIAEADGVLEKAKAIRLRDRMKQALEKFWNWVGTELFGMRFDSIEQVTDRVLYDLVNKTDLGTIDADNSVEASIVTDKKTLDWLNGLSKDDLDTGYRTVELKEGDVMESPMGNSLRGNGTSAKTEPFMFKQWEQSDEHPELVKPNGKIDLVKPDGKTVNDVDYNPYIHIRPDKVNKQFRQAWERPNLVYIKTLFPKKDEVDGRPFKADKAAKAVGRYDNWNGGTLILSRYDMPVGKVSWEEVADDWMKVFGKKPIHFDIISPHLLPILTERGANIVAPHKGMGEACNAAYQAWKEPQRVEGEAKPLSGKAAVDAEVQKFLAPDRLSITEAGKRKAHEAMNEQIASVDVANMDDIERSEAAIEKGLSGAFRTYYDGMDLTEHSDVPETVKEAFSNAEYKHEDIPAELERMIADERTEMELLKADVDADPSDELSRKFYEESRQKVADMEKGLSWYNDHKYEMTVAPEEFFDNDGRYVGASNVGSDTILDRTDYPEDRHKGESAIDFVDRVVRYLNEKYRFPAPLSVVPRDCSKQELGVILGYQGPMLDKVYELYLEKRDRSAGMKVMHDKKVFVIAHDVMKKTDYIVKIAFHETIHQFIEDRYRNYADGELIGYKNEFAESFISSLSEYAPDIIGQSEFDKAMLQSDSRGAEEFVCDVIASAMVQNRLEELMMYMTPSQRSFTEDFINGIGYVTENAKETGGSADRGRWTDSYSSPSSKRRAGERVAEKLGVKVRFVSKEEMPAGHGNSKGIWRNGEILVCLVNNTDANDTVKTVLHEAVGHNGLRKIVGNDKMSAFCMKVYRKLPETERERIARAAVNKYGGDVALATEEYLAEQAEGLRLYNRFGDIVMNVIEWVKGLFGAKLTPADVRWMLWNSYNANKSGIDIDARRARLAHRLGFSYNALEARAQANDIIRDRAAKAAHAESAADIYNRQASSAWARLHESFVDQFKSVNDLQEAIGGDKVKDFENVSWALNQQSSRGFSIMEKWKARFYDRMWGQINRMIKRFGVSLEDLESYVMLKHGLERNIVLAKRDAKRDYKTLYDINVRSVRNNENLDEDEKEARLADLKTEYENNIANVEAGTDEKYLENRKKDYGGIMGMFAYYADTTPFDEARETEEAYQQRIMASRTYEYENLEKAEAEAQRMVDDMESLFGKEADELWKRINAATKNTLETQYKHGLMSREQYAAVRDMFEYYVPLRGFSEKTADDMYTYYADGGKGSYAAVVIGAKGRRTKAESPFAYIGAMASSGTASAVKNDSAMALYYLVSNRPDNGLVSLSEVWYEKEVDASGNPVLDADGNEVWNEVYPPFDASLSGSDAARQNYEQWLADMEQKQQDGNAVCGRKKLEKMRLNYVIHSTPQQIEQHIIRFKVMGKDMFMFIHGNPRAAQAVNGLLNIERKHKSTSGKIADMAMKYLRYMAALSTSWSPEFWMTNSERDFIYTMIASGIKEDKEWVKAFRSNMLKPKHVYSMMQAYKNGTLGDSYMEDLYREFVENGGPTGYTVVQGQEHWQEELNNYIREKGAAGEALESTKELLEKIGDFSESIEQAPRFAAYVASRSTGRSIVESVNDAKEISVNFNRKGSGYGIPIEECRNLRNRRGRKLSEPEAWALCLFSHTAPLARVLVMFFNASVQGLYNYFKLWKVNGKGAAKWTAGTFLLGFLNGMLHAMVDGDDDDYLDMPDGERRKRILLGYKGIYFMWALPQEMAVFYGLGDLLAVKLTGRRPDQNVLVEAVKIISDVSPVDVTGGPRSTVTLAAPAIDIALNENYYGGKVYNSNIDEKKPKYLQALNNTGDMWLGISRTLNWLSGGDEYEAGKINIDPNKLEHLVEGYTSGLGTTVTKLIDTVTNAANGKFVARDTPFLRRIVTINDERYRNSYANELYSWYEGEAKDVMRIVKEAAKAKDDRKLNKYMDKDGKFLPEYEYVNVYENYRHAIEQYKEFIKNETDDNVRRQLIKEQDALKKQMVEEIANLGRKDKNENEQEN